MINKLKIKTSLEFANNNIVSADESLVAIIKNGIIYVNGDAEKIDNLIDEALKRLNYLQTRHLKLKEISKARKEMLDQETVK